MAQFPTPEDCSAEDYARLGMKSGLEVHQQLATRHKLFCRCPAHHFTTDVHAEVLRHMRPTLSELGEYDGTALMEFKTKKQIIYRINRESVCTYELDDAPPFELNDEALEFSMEISLMFGCNIVGEVHIARKQYLDGSIPTGFQRTAIIGLDGAIPFRGRTVRVQQISVEEDSSREVSDMGHTRIFVTDRLSIPLIEVVTRPDMRTPEEVAAVATEIRKLTRSSRRAATGMGCSRQDVNVSVEGGTRIEIKGVPRIPLIPRLVHYEAWRQRTLLDIRDRLLARGLDPQTFAARVRDVTPQASLVQYGPIRQAVNMGGRLVAVVLPAPYSEALNTRVAPERPFAVEVSDRVRVVACLDALPNIAWFPCPESPFATATWSRLRQAAGADESEAVVLVWGNSDDVQTAAGEIEDRCREALLGVPSETRQVKADGTTGFERILPGPDRMYPDTDLPPTPVPAIRVDTAKARVPPPSWDQERYLAARGVGPFHGTEIAMEGWFDVAKAALDLPGINGARVGEVLVERARWLSRQGLSLHSVDRSVLLAALRRLGTGDIPRERLSVLLRQLSGQRRRSDPEAPEALIDACQAVSAEAMAAAVDKALAGPAPLFAEGEARLHFLMGVAMDHLERRAPGRAVWNLLVERAEVKA